MNDLFYDGAADAMDAPFEPKTPCRNMETRPCTVLTTKGDQRFLRKECLPHYCTRFTDHYEEGQIPHQMVLAESGPRGGTVTTAKDFELSELHDGPKCVRCGVYFCRWCNPNVFNEPCSNQDRTLF